MRTIDEIKFTVEKKSDGKDTIHAIIPQTTTGSNLLKWYDKNHAVIFSKVKLTEFDI